MTGSRVVAFVVGARPQFIKDAALTLQLRSRPTQARFTRLVINSGQHYDELMSDIFFRELPLDRPDRELAVGQAALDVQFGRILEGVTEILSEAKPSAVVVYGDTTTTLAAALAAAYRDLPLVHVEAGERAYQRANFPEELNRVLADHAASLCLTVSERARSRLRAEGISEQRIRVVGDLMYDLFCWAAPRQAAPASEGSYDVATLHRAENTDDPAYLLGLLRVLDDGPRPVILPAHPRLERAIAETGWHPAGALQLRPPVGYLEMVALVAGCNRVVTDSGGLMREAFFAARPCIVPLASPPWPELFEAGWAHASGRDLSLLADLLDAELDRSGTPPQLFGDGRAAGRVIDALNELLDDPGTDPERWRP